MNNDKIKEDVGLFVIVLLMTCIVVITGLDIHERCQVMDNIENTINVPDEYTIKIDWFSIDKKENDWYRCYVRFEKTSYICSEDEKINEPWKCEDITYEKQHAWIWYNTKTMVLYHESGSINVT